MASPNANTDLIECIPNVSEGRDLSKIREMCQIISSIEGTKLIQLDVNPDANRSVFTMAGPSDSVFQSAHALIHYCTKNIDMRSHQGVHPRIGAVDVCPFVNLGKQDDDFLIRKVEKWAEKIAEEEDIPIYLYEKSAHQEIRKNLANIRKGNYEKLPQRLKQGEWKPDVGTPNFKPSFGAMVAGLRDFLVAFNISFPGLTESQARRIASLIRYSSDSDTKLTGVKAIGWYMTKYQSAQVSINITDLYSISLYQVIQTTVDIAKNRFGAEQFSCELIGLMPNFYLSEAIDDFGVRDYDTLKQTIDLHTKTNGIPSIEYQILNPTSIEEWMRLQGDI